MSSLFADSFFVEKLNNKIKGTGYNYDGELGTNEFEITNRFENLNIPNGYEVDYVCTGYANTLLVMKDKSVWGSGINSGALGNDKYDDNTYSFTQMIIPEGYTLKSIHCGGLHSVVVMTDNSVWSCGSNRYGQLGILNNDNQYKLVQMMIPIGYTVDSVYCGTQQTFVLMTDGSLWGCGWNVYGTLGLGDRNNRNMLTKITLPAGKIIKSVSTSNTTHLLMTDGTLWGCGWNYFGQLGLGDNNDRNTFVQIPIPQNKVIDKVYASRRNTSLLMTDGTFWVCGLNNYGQLGQGHTDSLNQFTLLNMPANKTLSVICFASFSLYIFMTDHSVWMCGLNAYGDLGLGDYQNRSVLTHNRYVAHSQNPLSIQELKSINVNKYCYADYGYTLQDLMMHGFNLAELRNAEFTISELNQYYTFSKLEEDYALGKVTKEDFAAFGFIFNHISNYCQDCHDC